MVLFPKLRAKVAAVVAVIRSPKPKPAPKPAPKPTIKPQNKPSNIIKQKQVSSSSSSSSSQLRRNITQVNKAIGGSSSVSRKSSSLRSSSPITPVTPKTKFQEIDENIFGGFLPFGVSRASVKTQNLRDKTVVDQERLNIQRIQTDIDIAKSNEKIRKDLGTRGFFEFFGGGDVERSIRSQNEAIQGAKLQIDIGQQRQDLTAEGLKTVGFDPFKFLSDQILKSEGSGILSKVGLPIAVLGIGALLLFSSKKK